MIVSAGSGGQHAALVLAYSGGIAAHVWTIKGYYETLPAEIEEAARHWGFELYSANAAELALVIYENPDVLFCAAAGNEDSNNDETLVYPAYLSRFFPNVTTVAVDLGVRPFGTVQAALTVGVLATAVRRWSLVMLSRRM